ncbi:MAG: FixH family protein [Burkholderiales bacterium]|nr:FixH family protein [Betaproteobacteria bacterium]
MRPSTASRVWYREPWPWFLAAGPFTVVVAGAITVWLAVKSDDGLVADDYYKQGLAINQVIRRDQTAAELGLRANVQWNFDNQRVRVYLRSDATAPLPDTIVLRVLHPTRAGADQAVTLRGAGGGVYDGALLPLRNGRWLLGLEDGAQTWRLMGEMFAPRDAEVTLVPQPV